MPLYNDNDPRACCWLGELVQAGHLPPGQIDSRSIHDLQPHDLTPHPHIHLFAGIGGWAYALKLAGWPDDLPVWTGSCPCQPFSCAGRGLGATDPRHLWPEMLRLIAECRPATVFGEQVAGKAGRLWLAGVRADLEALGYAVGASDLCAAGVGAPHIRQRLFWVAHNSSQRLEILRQQPAREERKAAERGGEAGGLDDPASPRHSSQGSWQPEQPERGQCVPGLGCNVSHWSDYDLVHCRDGKTRRIEPGTFPLAHGLPARVVRLRGYGNAIVPQAAAEFVMAFMEAAVEMQRL